ncbi:hypothetical protein TcasGA2_TC010968 [Tribolium castaneum]|uniref:Uncharacterized protein n=1 Tax=Tribolium castaneum TaxID=7070 RepID=D6X1H2_TRICA|nr:hypothetical protein TcasGA2_TC010968 [Tribolium castaneum]
MKLMTHTQIELTATKGISTVQCYNTFIPSHIHLTHVGYDGKYVIPFKYCLTITKICGSSFQYRLVRILIVLPSSY